MLNRDGYTIICRARAGRRKQSSNVCVVGRQKRLLHGRLLYRWSFLFHIYIMQLNDFFYLEYNLFVLIVILYYKLE